MIHNSVNFLLLCDSATSAKFSTLLVAKIPDQVYIPQDQVTRGTRH